MTEGAGPIDHADPSRLRVLAAWVEELERPGFTLGTWSGGQRDAECVIHMPYVEYSAEGLRFMRDMGAGGWVYPFDWMAWASTPEGRILIEDPARIADASADDLARLLTTIIRGDRFSEGQVLGAHERGTLTAIARRARTLLDEGGDAVDVEGTSDVARLRRLVESETPSIDPAACRRALELVAVMIEEDVRRSPAVLELSGGTPALLLAATAEPRVLLLCHVDTVWPAGALASFPFAVTGGRATGPGTFDMKAGIVLALGALRRCRASEHITLLITADEEIGSVASRELIEREAGRAAAVLVLEGAGPGGSLKHARKGVAFYELEIVGRAAHAGTEPEKGVNATEELARLVLDVVGLADPEAGTSVTPTAARSGTTTNTVPAAATLAVDVRAWRASELQRVHAAIRSRIPAVPGAVVHVGGGPNRLPLEPELSAGLLALARAAATELGLGGLGAVAVGAGSDGNLTAALGVPTLDGLGAVGGEGHALGEWIDLASLEARARLVARLVELIVAPGVPAG